MFPDAGRSLETVSLDLREALSALEELQQVLSASESVKADDDTQLAEMGTRFFKGLSAIHLVCNTGQFAFASYAAQAVFSQDPATSHSSTMTTAIALRPSCLRYHSLSCPVVIWKPPAYMQATGGAWKCSILLCVWGIAPNSCWVASSSAMALLPVRKNQTNITLHTALKALPRSLLDMQTLLYWFVFKLS